MNDSIVHSQVVGSLSPPRLVLTAQQDLPSPSSEDVWAPSSPRSWLTARSPISPRIICGGDEKLVIPKRGFVPSIRNTTVPGARKPTGLAEPDGRPTDVGVSL